MPKLPQGKEQLATYINKAILKDLRYFVKSKNDGMYGLSHTVEVAIRNFLAKQNLTQFPHCRRADESRNIPHKVWELKRQLREYISRTHNFSVDEIGPVSKQQLEEAISQLKGHDPRTIKKHINALIRSNCLMDNRDGSFDIS